MLLLTGVNAQPVGAPPLSTPAEEQEGSQGRDSIHYSNTLDNLPPPPPPFANSFDAYEDINTPYALEQYTGDGQDHYHSHSDDDCDHCDDDDGDDHSNDKDDGEDHIMQYGHEHRDVDVRDTHLRVIGDSAL